MKTKTREFEEIKQSEKTEAIAIPKSILDEVWEKWFYVYERISNQEVKTSIQIDFMRMMRIFWPIWIILAFLSFVIWNIFWVILFIGFISILMVIYVTILSIYKSIQASKISNVIITNKYFSVNKKIWKIKDKYLIELDKQSAILGKSFWEELFLKSNLWEKKKSLSSELVSQFSAGASWIFRDSWFGNNGKEGSFKIMLFLVYIAFVIAMGIIYFFGIFITAIFWIFINFLIKSYLIWKWNLVLLINEYFKDIEKYSSNLKESKQILSKELEQAKENDWSEWRLTKINKWLWTTNKIANKAFDESQKLVEEIRNSEYNQIFDYNLYNSWLNKQLSEPMQGIYDILEENANLIKNEILKNNETLQNSIDEKLKWHLELANKRLEMKKKQIDSQKNNIFLYLQKIKINKDLKV